MFYTLEGKRVVRCDARTFIEGLKSITKREIARTEINWKKVIVVTYFTGLNYDLLEEDPLFFSTTVYGGKYDSQSFHSSTYEEAEQLHELIVGKIKSKSMSWCIKN